VARFLGVGLKPKVGASTEDEGVPILENFRIFVMK